MSKYRMSQIAVMDDNTYCEDFRINEYHGGSVKLYVTSPEGKTYEYYIANRKGDLAVVRRTWGGEWEFVTTIDGLGDDTPVNAWHRGQGKLRIRYQRYMTDSPYDQYVLQLNLAD